VNGVVPDDVCRKAADMSSSSGGSEKLRALVEAIGHLSGDLELDVLLGKAMEVCTKIACADRSSLFLYDRENDELWSKVAQGINTLELRFPAASGLAGEAARSGAVVNVPDAYADDRFNREFDKKTGYRTRSVLCVPMKDVRGRVLGVMQVLNKENGQAFDADDVEMLLAVGAHFAVFIENSQLYESIERLFEAFVQSSSTAIDERDPATAGHSRRVAKYALNLARALHEHGLARFTRARLRQLRYAALLHDFGKVGVREAVLMKRYKIDETHEELIAERFKRIALEKSDTDDLDEALALVVRVNRAGFLPDEDEAAIRALSERGLLTEGEIECLTVKRGNLTPTEWRDMKSHAERSKNILSQIPWPEELCRVPEIAVRHHEKLDGTGYPLGVGGDEIELDARILEVVDIYDALTARDRPYKPAMPHEKARKILEGDAAAGKIDKSLVDLFFERELHKIELTGGTRVVTQVG
jgi:HD-GYP domain-containing protein (c-di-GMP phosphodiesterase class II)